MTWYCDHKSPNCDRGTGLYTYTRWSNRWKGGGYDLCNACARYHQVKDTGVWESSVTRKGSEINISGNTVTKTNRSWGHGTAIIRDAITLTSGCSAKKRWSFTIKAGKQTTIGLVTASYNATTD